MSVIASNLGFPRLGSRRELKKALEQYWSGEIAREELVAAGGAARREGWTLQATAGLDHIPSNDFSFYDHVLDMACVVGAVPERYRALGLGPIDTYFAMARGIQSAGPTASQMIDLPALQMTKWFDTNYHYIVPEFDHDQEFELESTKPVDEFAEAKGCGIETRPVLIGPVSLLLLGRTPDGVGRTSEAPGSGGAINAALLRINPTQRGCQVPAVKLRLREGGLRYQGQKLPGHSPWITRPTVESWTHSKKTSGLALC